LKRNPFASKFEHGLRHLMVNHLTEPLGLVIVTEFPKSGGSWYGQMLAEYLGIPFPRNRLPPLSACLMHGHYLPSPGMRRVIPVVRDGRDVMVSWYHHCYFVNERYNERLVARMKRLLPFENYDDVAANLPAFIRFVFETGEPIGFNWRQFMDGWKDEANVCVRYERLLTDPVAEMAESIRLGLGREPDITRLVAICDKYRFEKQASRSSGQERKNSFLRKGVAGDWKNYFTEEAMKVFIGYAGYTMVEWDYEKSCSMAVIGCNEE
jgi:hypothetical protein